MSLLLLLVQLLVTTSVSCQSTWLENGLSTGCYESEYLGQVKQRLDSLDDTVASLQHVVQGLEKNIVSIHRSVNGQISYPSLTYVLSGDQYVGSLTSFNNQLFVTRRYSSQIAVHNTSTFEFIRYISVPPGVDWLAGLVPNPTDNCLYVSDYNNSKVHKIKIDEGAVTSSWLVPSQPLGLSVNRNHNILVATESKKIHEYTPSGTLVREISDSNVLYHAVELTDGNLVVSREGPMHAVCLMSVNGTVLRCYGTRGSETGQFNFPHTLAVDGKGFIFVADAGNSRIVVLNPTLFESRILSLPIQLNQPRAIWLDESKGRLYVGESGSLYRVLVFDNVFNIDAASTP